MKTDDMIALLSANVAPADLGASGRRYAAGLLPGVLGAFLLMLAIYGLRPDLGAMAATPLFWAKVAFPAVVAAGALAMATRLSRPGMPAGRGGEVAGAAVALVWIAGAVLFALAPAGDRLALVLGISWRSCPFNIALLSVPTFAGAFWAMKGLAPTRPRAAGAAAGLLASALATLVYCLHCPEMSPVFWAVWYVLGLAIPAAAGALAGPRLLRW